MSVADLTTQLEAALGALSTPFSVLDSGTLDSQRVARGAYAAAVRVAQHESATVGSNLTVAVASVEVDLVHRAAGSTPAQLGAAEDALALLVALVAVDSFWTGLAAVRPSPIDVGVESDLERVGESIRYTVRAECALEG